MSDRETRCLMTPVQLVETPEEYRAAPGRKYPGTLRGYASVCGPMSEELIDEKGRAFREKVAPGAFARALETCDIRGMVNHDPGKLIGRMKNRTLRMTEDELGLRYEIDLPDTQVGHDTAELVKRGDMDGSSFSFDIEPGGDEWDHNTQPPTRTIRSVARLYDVGPVTFPAYTDTSAAMRSLDRSKPDPASDRVSPSLAKARLRQALAESPI